jgi:hypothetical protein
MIGVVRMVWFLLLVCRLDPRRSIENQGEASDYRQKKMIVGCAQKKAEYECFSSRSVAAFVSLLLINS